MELRPFHAETEDEARESLGAGRAVSTETIASGAPLLHAEGAAGERIGRDGRVCARPTDASWPAPQFAPTAVTHREPQHGSIVLMHDIQSVTAGAFDDVLAG